LKKTKSIIIRVIKSEGEGAGWNIEDTWKLWGINNKIILIET
jgi:hypothetical protein